MLLKGPAGYLHGYTSITELEGKHREMLIGFGTLRLEKGDLFSAGGSDERSASGPAAMQVPPDFTVVPQEKAFLLLSGTAEISWNDTESNTAAETISRHSAVNEMPAVLHVSRDSSVTVRALEDGTEFCIIRRENDRSFEPRFLRGSGIRRVTLSSGRAAEETKRELRVAADDEGAPVSEMTFGEVLNYPGKWSSYPPHYHPHPEIYHYRFEPENGFGYAEEGGEVYRVTSGDTLLVAPQKVHPQTAAPGYAMVYIWAMPHLKEERFGKDSRKFESEHCWVIE